MWLPYTEALTLAVALAEAENLILREYIKPGLRVSEGQDEILIRPP